jgi:uncharacterized protein (DUF1499 family)
MIRTITLALAVVAVALLVLAGPGSRLGVWEFRTGFVMFRWAAYLGIAAAILCLVLLLRRPATGRVWLALALVVALVAVLVPWGWMRTAKRVPPIHDITTDTEHPPEFVAVLPLRAQAPNSAIYGGAEIAAQQRQAYPDVQPLMVKAPTAATFDRALAAARAMGWEIVAADGSAGRIEATATTRWFGFKDDVVVRITPEGSGSRVDVRSVSRVGKSDVGTNAGRIREYLKRVG